jgi:hypothetical protein
MPFERYVARVGPAARASQATDAGVVVPVVAAMAARIVLWSESAFMHDDAADAATNEWNGELLAGARTVAHLAENGGWHDDDLAYIALEDFIEDAWPMAYLLREPTELHEMLALPLDTPWVKLCDAATAYLRSQGDALHLPTALDVMLLSAHHGKAVVAARHAIGRKPRRLEERWNSQPLLAPPLKGMRALLAPRIRALAEEGTWPSLLASTWRQLGVEWLIDRAVRTVSTVAGARRRIAELEARTAAVEAAAGAARDDASRAVAQARAAATTAAEARVAAEIEALRAQLDAARSEAATARGRAARAVERAESLAAGVAALEAQCARLEAELATTRPASGVVEPRLPAAVAADSLPEEAWAGQRVLIFTQQARGSARADMEVRALALGAARVEVFLTSRSRGPDPLPSDAIVIVDVTFMAHTDSDALKGRARKAGCFLYEGRHGAATLCEAAARAWLEHRAGAAR